MHRLFFTGSIGDIQRLQVRYASECKVFNDKGLERICKPLLESKAKTYPLKQSVKFKCKIWSKVTKKLDLKGLDASSL